MLLRPTEEVGGSTMTILVVGETAGGTASIETTVEVLSLRISKDKKNKND